MLFSDVTEVSRLILGGGAAPPGTTTQYPSARACLAPNIECVVGPPIVGPTSRPTRSVARTDAARSGGDRLRLAPGPRSQPGRTFPLYNDVQ